MEEVIEEITMKGYCDIEKTETRFKLLPNGKWLCMSGVCSMAAGQVKYPPKVPKKERYL